MKPKGICFLELSWNITLLLFSFPCIGSVRERLISLQDSDMERHPCWQHWAAQRLGDFRDPRIPIASKCNLFWFSPSLKFSLLESYLQKNQFYRLIKTHTHTYMHTYICTHAHTKILKDMEVPKFYKIALKRKRKVKFLNPVSKFNLMWPHVKPKIFYARNLKNLRHISMFQYAWGYINSCRILVSCHILPSQNLSILSSAQCLCSAQHLLSKFKK